MRKIFWIIIFAFSPLYTLAQTFWPSGVDTHINLSTIVNQTAIFCPDERQCKSNIYQKNKKKYEKAEFTLNPQGYDIVKCSDIEYVKIDGETKGIINIVSDRFDLYYAFLPQTPLSFGAFLQIAPFDKVLKQANQKYSYVKDTLNGSSLYSPILWTSYKFVQNGKYNVVKFVYEKDAKEYTVDYTNKGLKVGKDFISKTEYEQFVEEQKKKEENEKWLNNKLEYYLTHPIIATCKERIPLDVYTSIEAGELIFPYYYENSSRVIGYSTFWHFRSFNIDPYYVEFKNKEDETFLKGIGEKELKKRRLIAEQADSMHYKTPLPDIRIVGETSGTVVAGEILQKSSVSNSKSQTQRKMSLSSQSSSSGRCKAMTRKGVRCKRQAEQGGYCWQHQR